jgi:hypothetical protein
MIMIIIIIIIILASNRPIGLLPLDNIFCIIREASVSAVWTVAFCLYVVCCSQFISHCCMHCGCYFEFFCFRFMTSAVRKTTANSFSQKFHFSWCKACLHEIWYLGRYVCLNVGCNRTHITDTSCETLQAFPHSSVPDTSPLIIHRSNIKHE